MNLMVDEGKDKYMTEKKRRTFEDLIKEGFASEEDLVELRNILIDANIVIVGNKYSGLPLLLAILCEVMQDELEIIPTMLYESEYNFESKIQEALNTEKDRVIIQQVSNINTLLKAESILKVGNPVIICVDTEINLPLDYNNFDYLIEMGKYPQQGIKKIKSLK